MNVWGKRIVGLLIVVALLVAGGMLVKKKKMQNAAAPAGSNRPTPVRVETAYLGDLSDTRTYLSKVRPWRSAALAGQITARIMHLALREGELVKKGQDLVILDDREIRSALAEAEAVKRSLEKTVTYWQGENDRDQMLVNEGAIARAMADGTADRLNEVQGRFEAQKRRRDELAARLDYTRIISPFAGIVARRLADPGDMAVPGKTLLVIEDHARLRVTFDVPQEDMDKVMKGTKVLVQANDSLIPLQVSRRYPSLNEDRTLPMEADAGPVAGLIPGAYYPVRVVLEELKNAVIIPEVCLIPAPDNQTAVFTVEDNKTVAREVTVRLVRDGLAAVSGINEGARLVRSTYLGWNRLAAGEAVEVLE